MTAIKINIKSHSDAFGYEAYHATYTRQHRSRGSASLPERQKLFREAKRRLEHGVPVGMLIRDVARKLRMMQGGAQ